MWIHSVNVYAAYTSNQDVLLIVIATGVASRSRCGVNVIRRINRAYANQTDYTDRRVQSALN